MNEHFILFFAIFRAGLCYKCFFFYLQKNQPASQNTASAATFIFIYAHTNITNIQDVNFSPDL